MINANTPVDELLCISPLDCAHYPLYYCAMQAASPSTGSSSESPPGPGTEFTTCDVRAQTVQPTLYFTLVEGQGYTCLLYVNPHVTKLKELTVINLPPLFGTGTIFAAKTMKSRHSCQAGPKIKITVSTPPRPRCLRHSTLTKALRTTPPRSRAFLSTQQLSPREQHTTDEELLQTSMLAGRAVTVGAPLRT
jgi:hypothetical protein